MSTTNVGGNHESGLLSKKVENSIIWKVKVRLQFTGWMQYIPNMVMATVALLLAGIGWLIGFAPVFLFWLPLTISGLLFSNLIFDLITVKAGFKPKEAIPSPQTELDAFELMRARQSCRSFQSRDLTEDHRTEILEKAQLYSQPEQLLGDKPIRFEYIAVPLTVWPVVGAHEFLVAIAPKAYDRMAVIDVGRSLQKIVVDATRMGVGTCWIGPGADHKSIIKKLGERFDSEEDHIICVCALGYPSWFKPLFIRMTRFIMGGRLPMSSLFFAEPSFQKPMDIEAEPFNTYGRCYEVCRWAPSSYNSQTTRFAAVVKEIDGTQQITRFDFAASTKSRYYAAVSIGIWAANWEMGCEALGKSGEFRVLTPEERDVPDAPELPKYDISWVVK